jgi:hypothetical protein
LRIEVADLFFVYYFKGESDGASRADHLALLTVITIDGLNHPENCLDKDEAVASADIDA